ncbi:hypothetical protein C0995_008781 [Termitomyces sp. Mi166|nr:hypothetical protein C0995_008781 [Termitomyces sp. Mi166\
MSTSTSASSSFSSALTSSAMPSSTSSLSISLASTTSESSSSSHTTSSSSISIIPSSTSSSTLPSSISSSTTTQGPSTSTSQTISSRTTEPSTTLSSTFSSSPAPSPTPTSPTPGPISATTPIPTTTTHATNIHSASGVLTETTVTSIFTTTSNGQVVTITEVSVSQTLSPNKSNSKDDSFFQNTGAVAGVFVVVGLAAASIFLWILFALRRRRRTRRLEHDTAVSATLAAAGFHRTPLDDDDENENANGSRRSRFGSPEVEMHNRTSSGFASTIPSGARTSAYFDSPQPDDPDAFNPYRDYVVDTPPAASGTNPPFFNGFHRDRTSSGEHTHDHSASGSYEPLLASYYRQEQAASLPVLPSATSPPNPPPRNPLRLSDAGRSPPLGVLSKTLPDIVPAEAKSTESIGDDRLDPGLRQRMNEETDSASQRDLKDEEDYSRPVLGVRNLPNASEASQEA